MTDYLGKLRAGTGGKAATAYEAGESAVNALKAGDKAKEEAVGELYDAFRASGAQDANVPAKIADAARQGRRRDRHREHPGGGATRLKEFGLARREADEGSSR
jgi:hypothetical protein